MARMWLFWACIGSAMCCNDTEHRSTPIVAVMGRSVLLPCTNQSVKPNRVQDYRVYWQIPISEKDSLLVHFLNLKKKEEPELHHPRFQNRTKLSFEDGTFSLQLLDVRLDDKACFKCLVSFGSTGRPRESLLNLQVSARYNEPVLHTREGPSKTSRTITCSASGGYPEADVHWTIDGEPVANDSRRVQRTPSKQAANGTYTVSSSLTAKASERVECIIENKHLKENRSASVIAARNGTSGLTSSSGLALRVVYVAFIYLLGQWIFWQI